MKPLNISWSIGLHEAKNILNDVIILPTLFGDDCASSVVHPCNAVLMYGVSSVEEDLTTDHNSCQQFSLPVLAKHILHERLLLRPIPASSPSVSPTFHPNIMERRS